MQIGTFKKDGSAYSGTIETLTIRAEVTLEPVRSSNDKAPDFRVHFGETEVGIAYKKTSEKGNEYLSLKLDDPIFATPFWCNLLLTNGLDGLPLMWGRHKPKAKRNTGRPHRCPATLNKGVTTMDILKLTKRLAKHGYIASIWSIEDVQQERPDLTDEQCMEVLQRCEHKHDAYIGINWDVIRVHAQDLFPEPREDNV